MSHVTDVKLKITDLDALEAAAVACGLELRRDQTTYAWWGSFMNDSRSYGEHLPAEMGHCAHALRIPGDRPKNGSAGPWEVGVVPAKDGSGFNLVYDTFGGAGSRLTQKVGPGANTLRKEYAAAAATGKAMQTLARKGWGVTREDVAGGAIRLKLRKR